MKMMLVAAAALLMTGMAASADATEVTFGGGDNGYMVFPEQAGRAPAILLLHDWSGPTERMLDEAQTFADQGYVVLVPDLFNGVRPTTPDAARTMVMQENIEAQRARIKRTLMDALTYLSVRPGVDADDIALVGFDIGATIALKAGMEGFGVDAVVAYEPYASVLAEVGRVNFENAEMPILTHFAEADKADKPTASLEQELTGVNDMNKVYHYPVVDPGFMITSDGQYDEAAAKLARKRTLDFLDKNL